MPHLATIGELTRTNIRHPFKIRVMNYQTLQKAKQLEESIARVAEDIRQVERIGGRENIKIRLGVVFGESANHTLNLSPEAVVAAVAVILCDLRNRLADRKRELELM